MPTSPAFRRLNRRAGIDRFAGLPRQFEWTTQGWLFRRHGHGPAIPVTDDEYAGFMRAGLRAVVLHGVALPVFGWLAWLVLDRLLPTRGENAIAALFGIVVSLIGIALYGSLRHRAEAPARALAARPPVAPARDPDGAAQPHYTTIVTVTVLLLVMAALGTRQPASAYVAFASASVMLGVILAVRRWRFDAVLTVIQRERLRERRVAEREAERMRRQADGHWWQGLLLLVFVALELAFLACGVLLGVGVAAAIAGQAASAIGFGVFMLGFLPGLALGALMFWPLEKLCKRWTGSSAIHAFDWLPASW